MTDDITPETPEQPTEPTEPTEGTPEAKHGFKEDVRDAIGKVVGIAVETGSMLSGNAGEVVSAEGALAEKDTEELLDRIDGEG